MNLRGIVQQLAIEHRLDARARGRLERIAGFGVEPAALHSTMAIGVALLAAALLGFGLILWIAANWQALGRFGRFGLLQAVVVVMGIGAIWRQRQRAALALVLLLATGALFATFGQTYQTGADPWQLFALWAALTLALCLGLRCDVLWVPWLLVAMTAVALWVYAHAGHRFGVRPDDLAVHAIGALAALAIVAAMSAPARAWTGAGAWSLRSAATLAVAMLTLAALGGLFGRTVSAQYLLGLAALLAVAAWFATRRGFDVFALSAAALGVDALLVAGLARWMFEGGTRDAIGMLLVIGAFAAAVLAATVGAVMKVARHRGGEELAR